MVEDLGYDALLGRELDSWNDLKSHNESNSPNILVMTRAQKQQNVHKEILAQDYM